MPNSLRCKLKKLKHQGLLTDKDCERLITALDKADKGWISIKDRLPDDDVSILICSERKTISKATYSSDMGRYYIADSDLWYNELDITHWMPLPEPPKGE